MLHIGIANAKLKVMLATLGRIGILSYHRTLSPALHFMRFFFLTKHIGAQVHACFGIGTFNTR